MTKALFLMSGLYFNPTEEMIRARFELLSNHLEGKILRLFTWERVSESILDELCNHMPQQ